MLTIPTNTVQHRKKNRSHDDHNNTTRDTRIWNTICNRYLQKCFDIYFTEFGTALTTILPILLQYCYKYWYSDSRNLWAVMKAGGLALYNLIQPTIYIEMPVPSQGHYGFHSFPVVDWFCLFIYFVRLLGVR